MQVINFFIVPIDSFENVRLEIVKLNDLVSLINKNSDNVLLPKGFYDANSNGETIFDNMNHNSDTSFYINFLGKLKTTDLTIDMIDDLDYHYQLLAINQMSENRKHAIVRTKEDLLFCYQQCAYQLKNFSELFDWRHKCFPELLFVEDSFGKNNNAFDIAPTSVIFEIVYRQTVDSLSLLNNSIGEMKPMTIQERIRFLQAELPNITCSGKGRNEDKKYIKKISFFKSGSLVEEKVVCAPHLKFYREDSDYRLFFAFENVNIHPYSYIIIKLGGHWINEDSLISLLV